MKFKEGTDTRITRTSTNVRSGIESLDKWFDFFLVSGISLLIDYELKNNKIRQARRMLPLYRIRYDLSFDARQLCSILEKDSHVVYAEPVYIIYSMATYPNDALYQSGEQWYIDEVNAPAAWDLVTCDTTQIIAIIDSGVDWGHPDLDGNIWINREEIPGNGLDDDNNGFIDDIRGWDFTINDNDPDDDNGHGTHVAGIAAAETDNYLGIAGIAWNARIMPLKVLTGAGHGNTSWLASAIYYAADNGATVINLSLGTYAESQAVKDALLYAYETLTIVGAAGNDNLKVDTIAPPNQAYGPMYPGCYPFVIGVEAGNMDGTLASFSNFDPSGFSQTANPEDYNYEIIAPGVNIFSTFPGGGYRSLTGTSMASPIVAGTVALLKDFMPGISNEEIFARVIQFAQAGHLKIPNILSGQLEPDLLYVEHALIDTIGNADHDGCADSDETFDLWFTVKNAGGYADSVWAILRLNNPGDSCLVSILDSLSYIGDIDSAGFHNEVPAYTSLTGELDPFRVYIKPDVIHGKDIVFEYEIGAKNGGNFTGNFFLTIQSGEELKGMLDSTLVLTPDKFWIVNQSFKIIPGGILRLNPGVHLKIDQRFILKGGHIESMGTPDSMVVIEGPKSIRFETGEVNYYNHTLLTGFNEGFVYGNHHFDNCIFNDYNTTAFTHSEVEAFDCQFTAVSGVFYWGAATTVRCNFDNPNGLFGRGNYTAKFCNIVKRNGLIGDPNWADFDYNNFITSGQDITYVPWDGPDYAYILNHYWGTINNEKIERMIFDFWDNPEYPLVIYEPKLNAPADSAHGVVWKVLVNNVDPQDEHLDPLGIGNTRFDVYFNKPMDTLYAPLLTFGVRDPLTQHVIENNASWSNDSTIWTAYYNITQKTGDGMNYIRVANAVDTAGFIIPNENTMRFGFNIQAASSTSIQFLATPGIGKIYLEWPYEYLEDFLGYNMYRFEKYDDGTTSDTLIINDVLIHDSIYTDYNVIPDSIYYYCYKLVGTDLKESGFSKVISAKPLSTANGDANGDEELNVLDITAIIAYILEQEPQPFLFEAADVNYDGQINVLDMVMIIQVITGMEKSMTASYTIIPEFINFDKNGIYLESEGQISAMQFDISGNIPDDIRLFCKTEGLEFCYNHRDDRIIGILFSYGNKVITQGLIELVSMNDDIGGFKWNDIQASNPHGIRVPVYTEKHESFEHASSKMECFPNPFTSRLQITLSTPPKCRYEMHIRNGMGAALWTTKGQADPSGETTFFWNGISNNGTIMPSGVYFIDLRIYAQEDVKVLSTLSTKVILIR